MSRLATFFLVIGLGSMALYILRDVPRVQEAMERSRPLAESAADAVGELAAVAQEGFAAAPEWAESAFAGAGSFTGENSDFAAEVDAVRDSRVDQLTDIAIAAGASDDCLGKTVRELDAPCLKATDMYIAEVQAELAIAENALRNGKASVPGQSLTAEEAASLREEIATATYLAMAAEAPDSCWDITFGDMSDECRALIQEHLDGIKSQTTALRGNIRKQLARIGK